MTRVLLPFEGGIADGRHLPVTLMMATGRPPRQVVVSFLESMHDGYEFDADRGSYVLVAR